MNNLDLKDLVILDVLEYNELMERISKGNKKYYENEKLYKIYEKYYWNEIKEQKTYDLKNIQDYTLDDYYFRDIVVICLKDEITDLEYITKMIKQIKKEYDKENEKS